MTYLATPCNAIFQASIAAERTRQADDIDKAFAGLADGVGELKEQIRNNTERQEMVREAESRKCQLEIEFLEKRKSRIPATTLERDALMAKLKADLADIVSKKIMTKEVAGQWFQKQVMSLYGWGAV